MRNEKGEKMVVAYTNTIRWDEEDWYILIGKFNILFLVIIKILVKLNLIFFHNKIKLYL